jgi:xanthine dehydrogenase accessory factor
LLINAGISMQGGSEATAGSSVAKRDREAAIFEFLAQARAAGVGGALVSISSIEGGAPRPVGTNMAVLADGWHLGHISGGCVEAAIAAEVAPLISGGQDQVIRFGRGSRFMDIRFPCGGGVDLLVHVAPAEALLADALMHFTRREPFVLDIDPMQSTSRIVAGVAHSTGWQDGTFRRRYLPRTRLVVAGRGPDFEMLARVAAVAEFDLHLATPDEGNAQVLAAAGIPVEHMTSFRQLPSADLDPWTATVLLFHEHEWEDAILAAAASGPGFYVGALGSPRTHRMRCERLKGMGVPREQIDRIHGPIGLIGHARDPSTLALSVLAEIASVRAQIDQA